MFINKLFRILYSMRFPNVVTISISVAVLYCDKVMIGNNNQRHCGLVGSAPTWDGTGCEFDSWQCRINIPSFPCSLSLRLLSDYFVPFGVFWVHMVWPENCVKKTRFTLETHSSMRHRNQSPFEPSIHFQRNQWRWKFSHLPIVVPRSRCRSRCFRMETNLPSCLFGGIRSSPNHRSRSGRGRIPLQVTN